MQETAGSQRLQLLVPNLGTIGYHCKELTVPRDWNSWLANLETESYSRFLEIGTPRSQRGNCGLPLQGTAVSCFAFWSGTQRFVLLIGPVHDTLF